MLCCPLRICFENLLSFYLNRQDRNIAISYDRRAINIVEGKAQNLTLSTSVLAPPELMREPSALQPQPFPSLLLLLGTRMSEARLIDEDEEATFSSSNNTDQQGMKPGVVWVAERGPGARPVWGSQQQREPARRITRQEACQRSSVLSSYVPASIVAVFGSQQEQDCMGMILVALSTKNHHLEHPFFQQVSFTGHRHRGPPSRECCHWRDPSLGRYTFHNNSNNKMGITFLPNYEDTSRSFRLPLSGWSTGRRHHRKRMMQSVVTPIQVERLALAESLSSSQESSSNPWFRVLDWAGDTFFALVKLAWTCR
jgi:hypothetical protein